MKKRMLVSMFAVMIAGGVGQLPFFMGVNSVFAVQEGKPMPITVEYKKFDLPPNSYIVSKQEIDVTGDNKPDTVSIVGTRTDLSSIYWEKLFVTVDDKANNKYTKFSAEGGYNPKTTFCDFTGDKVTQILLSAETGGSGGIVNYYLYSAKNDVAATWPVPKPLEISGSLEDNYVAKIMIKDQNKVYTVDLKERKQMYDEAGVYKDGKVVKPTSLMVNVYNELKPVDVNNDGVCELQGTQRISGIANADTIAYVISVWQWDKNQWKLVSMEVKKINQ